MHKMTMGRDKMVLIVQLFQTFHIFLDQKAQITTQMYVPFYSFHNVSLWEKKDFSSLIASHDL